MGVLDRYGEPIDASPSDVDDDIHARLCRDGFLGEDAHGAVIPCYRCRPHLKDRHLRRRVIPRKRRRR